MAGVGDSSSPGPTKFLNKTRILAGFIVSEACKVYLYTLCYFSSFTQIFILFYSRKFY